MVGFPSLFFFLKAGSQVAQASLWLSMYSRMTLIPDPHNFTSWVQALSVCVTMSSFKHSFFLKVQWPSAIPLCTYLLLNTLVRWCIHWADFLRGFSYGIRGDDAVWRHHFQLLWNSKSSYLKNLALVKVLERSARGSQIICFLLLASWLWASVRLLNL